MGFEDVIRDEASELQREFTRASKDGKGTSQEVADFRENAFRKLVERFYPAPHVVTKGKISPVHGEPSASIDCVVLNPAHPNTIDSAGKYRFIAADGVDLAIEVKPDVQDRSELVRGLKQVASVKRARRSQSPLISEKSLSANEVALAQTIPSFIYSMKAKSSIADTVLDAVGFYLEEKVPVEEQFDYLVIHDEGIVSNAKYPETSHFSAEDGTRKTGFFFTPWGDRTTAAFFTTAAASVPAVPTMLSPIISRYLVHEFGTYEGNLLSPSLDELSEMRSQLDPNQPGAGSEPH